jgi:hypothetical protein
MMPYRKNLLHDQNGTVILTVMLVLIAVSALSLTMMNFSTVEVNMAGNYKFEKTAFYNGDSGIYGTPKFIRLVFPSGNPVPEASPTQAGCVQFLNTTQTDGALEIMQRIYGFEGRDVTDAMNDTLANEEDPTAADISMNGCAIPADVNIIRMGGQQLSGGGVEFGAGAEGMGSGADRAVLFRLVSTGRDDTGNTQSIRALYRWVDVPGGL